MSTFSKESVRNFQTTISLHHSLCFSFTRWGAGDAMISLQDRELFPVQLILREILIANGTSDMTSGVSAVDAMPIGETVKYATIVVAT